MGEVMAQARMVGTLGQAVVDVLDGRSSMHSLFCGRCDEPLRVEEVRCEICGTTNDIPPPDALP
jgi:hypothetical protein